MLQTSTFSSTSPTVGPTSAGTDIQVTGCPRSLVVNFNSPELNQLALALARAGELARLVRPYVNKDRWWECTLAGVPMAGSLYRGTFGRRRLNDSELARLTCEAGIGPDLLAALATRLPALPARLRQRWTAGLHKAVREAVAEAARLQAYAPGAAVDCVVAYEGFALPAFQALARQRSGIAVLNYPVAHHRLRRQRRLQEIEREPAFASSWPDFDDWPDGHEQRLDDEIALADAVLVGSNYAARSFVDAGVDPAKMVVVPYGVDLATFHPTGDVAATAAPREGFEVICTGQLTQRKGLSYLLRGYQRFARAGTRLTLVGSVVGDGAALSPYAELFRHVPHQTRASLAERYRRADVFVLPTLIEGMPLVVLEAMACGLPVIVTDNGPGDIVRHGIDGYIVPECDDEAVADCLERLHRDPELRLAMGHSAAERAMQYSWAHYGDGARAALARTARDWVLAAR
jgi:glycosyltransferase involved in cell wall biosynthesis